MSPGSQVQMMTSADGLLGAPGPIHDSRGQRGSIDYGIGVRRAEIGELIKDVGPIDSRALVDRSVGLQREHHVLHVVRHSAAVEAYETERGRRIEDIRQSCR